MLKRNGFLLTRESHVQLMLTPDHTNGWEWSKKMAEKKHGKLVRDFATEIIFGIRLLYTTFLIGEKLFSVILVK